MTLVRENNRDCMQQRPAYRDVNDLFNAFWTVREGSSVNRQVPPANIIETPDTFRIEFSVPGLDKKDFSISVEDQLLTVSYAAAVSGESKNERFARQEFSINPFTRSFRLSRWVDSDHVAARYESGILIIEIPKREEAKTQPARLIEIA